MMSRASSNAGELRPPMGAPSPVVGRRAMFLCLLRQIAAEIAITHVFFVHVVRSFWVTITSAEAYARPPRTDRVHRVAASNKGTASAGFGSALTRYGIITTRENTMGWWQSLDTLNPGSP